MNAKQKHPKSNDKTLFHVVAQYHHFIDYVISGATKIFRLSTVAFRLLVSEISQFFSRAPKLAI